jgi:hypothetical protein
VIYIASESLRRIIIYEIDYPAFLEIAALQDLTQEPVFSSKQNAYCYPTKRLLECGAWNRSRKTTLFILLVTRSLDAVIETEIFSFRIADDSGFFESFTQLS